MRDDARNGVNYFLFREALARSVGNARRKVKNTNKIAGLRCLNYSGLRANYWAAAGLPESVGAPWASLWAEKID